MFNPYLFYQQEKNTGRRVIVVLEKAALETIKTKRGFELTNFEDHKQILKRHKKDATTYRPDILHQVRMASFMNFYDFCLISAGLLHNIVIKIF